MSQPITVRTAIGDLEVVIQGSKHAVVRGSGINQMMQVGKFAYRVYIYFVFDGKSWSVSDEWNRNSVYRHGPGPRFFISPAKTIMDRILRAAREALTKALDDHPLDVFSGDTDAARRAWHEAKANYAAIQAQLELAQVACNKAELAYYEAFDREAEATAALAEKLNI